MPYSSLGWWEDLPEVDHPKPDHVSFDSPVRPTEIHSRKLWKAYSPHTIRGKSKAPHENISFKDLDIALGVYIYLGSDLFLKHGYQAGFKQLFSRVQIHWAPLFSILLFHLNLQSQNKAAP